MKFKFLLLLTICIPSVMIGMDKKGRKGWSQGSAKQVTIKSGNFTDEESDGMGQDTSDKKVTHKKEKKPDVAATVVTVPLTIPDESKEKKQPTPTLPAKTAYSLGDRGLRSVMPGFLGGQFPEDYALSLDDDERLILTYNELKQQVTNVFNNGYSAMAKRDLTQTEQIEKLSTLHAKSLALKIATKYVPTQSLVDDCITKAEADHKKYMHETAKIDIQEKQKALTDALNFHQSHERKMLELIALLQGNSAIEKSQHLTYYEPRDIPFSDYIKTIAEPK